MTQIANTTKSLKEEHSGLLVGLLVYNNVEDNGGKNKIKLRL